MLAGDVATAVTGHMVEQGAAPATEPSTAAVATPSESDSAPVFSSVAEAAELVFIDDAVEDLRELAAALPADAQVVWIRAGEDPLVRMTEAVSAHPQVRSVHLLSHGAAGRLRMGNQIIDLQRLEDRADLLRRWAPSLTPDADVLIYGCRVAAEPAGRAFVAKFAELTTADVAASDDLTGDAAQGGDWELELQTGKIDSSLWADGQVLAGYRSLLALPAFADFSDSSQLVFNGTARKNNDALELTRSTGGLGSAFFRTPIAIDENTSFQTEFEFRIRDGQGANGADGLTFVLHNSAAGLAALTDTGGAGLGIRGLLNSLAVEFDTYQNPGDPNGNHIAVVANGDVANPLATAAVPFDLNSGQRLTAWVEYDGASNRLTVYASDAPVKPLAPWLAVDVDLSSLVGTQAIAGFTAATGGRANLHEILAWQLNTDPPSVPPPGGLVGLSSGELVVNEGAGEAVFTVLRQQGSVGTITVDYDTSPGTADADLDYAAVSGTLTFLEGETSQQVIVPLLSDSLFESSETFSFTIRNATGGAQLAEPTSTLVTINEDNANLPNFADFSNIDGLVTNGTATRSGNALELTPRFGGLGSAFFDRSLVVDGDTSFKTDFRFRIGDGQGTAGADGLTFMLQNSAAGTAAISSSSGGSLGYAGITNSLAIEFDTYRNATDIDANHVSVLIDGNVVSPVVTQTSPWDLNGGEILHAWVEYNAEFNQLKVYLSQDGIQPDESLLTADVDLAAIVGGEAYLGFSAATGGLVNRHELLFWGFNTETPPYAPPEGIVGLDRAQQTVVEADGTVTFVVSRTRGSQGTVSVDYQTVPESALVGTDFVAQSGTLVFAPGEKTKTIVVDLINDVGKEPLETFSLSLSNLLGGAVFGEATTTRVTIEDDDVRLPAFSDFQAGEFLEFNGAASRIGGALVLTPDGGNLGSAFFTDALPVNAETSFQTQFQFRIVGGDGVAGADGLVFMLQNSLAGMQSLAAGSGGSLGYQGIGNSLAIEFDTYQNPFDPSGNHVAILRDGDLTTPLPLSVELPDSPAVATGPFDLNGGQVVSVWVDYDGLQNELNVYLADTNFKPLAPLLTAEVDLYDIVGEQAILGFSAATGGLKNRHEVLNWQLSTAIPPSSPPEGVVGLSANQFEVNEATGSVAINVLRARGSEGTVTVDYRTVPVTALAGEDFVSQSGTLMFAPGETVQSIVLEITDDSSKEARESFAVTIENVLGGATLLAPRTATVTIIDDDAQLPQFTGFPTADNLALLGSTALFQNTLQLTPSFGGIGNAYFTDPLIVNAQSSFQTEFTFQIDLGDGTGGADGLVFMLQNSPEGLAAVSAGQGQGLGYAGIQNSLGIEFDTHQNDWDLNGNHVSVFANGAMEAGVALATATVPFELNAGTPVHVWVDYNGPSNQLAIYVSQTSEKPNGPLMTVDELALETLVGTQAYAGFSAATGGLVNRHRVLNWQLDTSVPTPINPSLDVNAVGQVVASGFNQPVGIVWSPDNQNLYVAEKGGAVQVIRNGSETSTTFIDLSGRVNRFGDRGLLGIAVHPDFANTPYVYLLYTYDPPETLEHLDDLYARPDGRGNRASQLIRVTADAATDFTTVVDGSEILLLGANSIWQNYNGFVDSTVDLEAPPAGLVTNGSLSDFNGYVVTPEGQTVLADGVNALPGGEPITFTNLRDIIVGDSVSHSIGWLEFGPDGALYVSTGDGASYNAIDPRALRVQDRDNLSGKILRIDPLTGKGLADNPFYDGDPDSNRSKVYQLGFRNPFRFTIDPTGELYVGDVGWSYWEEVNAGGAGSNFGWPFYEGGNGNSVEAIGYSTLPVSQAFYGSSADVTPAILALNHGEDGINAIVLSDYYTGSAYGADYADTLFFNDLGRGIVRNFTLDASGNVSSLRNFAINATYVVQMTQGPDGLLYYVDLDDGLIGRWILT